MKKVAAILLFLVSLPLAAQTPAELQKLQDEAVTRAKEYLRINTSNPPGNEVASMVWFAQMLKAEGIPFDTATSAPGRGNIWARLKGGTEPALVLLHHMDVVPADPRYWEVDPFSADVRNGDIFGRGALDTKLLGIAHFQTFIALHRLKVPLNRDVIFMATADEEAGGALGAGWIVKNRPDAFRGAGFVLNEGGRGQHRSGPAAGGHRGHAEGAALAQACGNRKPGTWLAAAGEQLGHAAGEGARAIAHVRVHAAHRPGRGRVLQGDRA